MVAVAVLAIVATFATSTSQAAGLPAGVPDHGRYAFLLKLDDASAAKAFDARRPDGRASARTAATRQYGRIREAQDAAIEELPAHSPVLYRMENVMAAVAVTTNVDNYAQLAEIQGVTHVYPIAPKSPENATAVALQRAPEVWGAAGSGYTGEGETIAVIDTGLDYTHADFGGPGTVGAFETAKEHDTTTPDPSSYDAAKFDAAASWDLVGDDYDAEGEGAELVAAPDPNPLDCEGHGTHVAGSAAGYGVTSGGATYPGPYNATEPELGAMRIGPGMAPGARLISYKVFGCEGSTDYVAAALDRAMDPNGDHDMSDHADVVNMSLGADYGSPEDGDTVAANAAVEAGITVVIASGNSGESADVGGSPGDASKAITVANSVDAGNVDDGLEVTIGTTPHKFGASRSDEYDWAHEPDLSGEVALAPADDPDACTALSSSDAAAVEGKVVLAEWNEGTPCGSAARSTNLLDAGATGVILAESSEVFAVGMLGSAAIPGVLVTKGGGEAIRQAIESSVPVEVDGTTSVDTFVSAPEDTDKLNKSSSRGIHATGNVKPDVAAVGTSVFSAGIGTGDQGESLSGTSMATPMVAGEAALLRGEHLTWTPEQIKADIVNTAVHDVTTGGNGTGLRYGPNRVGSGRIDAEQAAHNEVIAYDADDPGAVSASFGPVQVSAPTTLTKHITVHNFGTSAASYEAGIENITAMPGVTYSASPSEVTVPAGGDATVILTLSAPDPSALTKAVEATIGRTGANGKPRETLAEASGLLILTPVGDTDPLHELRVPVYAAPRPVATMTQESSVTMHGETGTLELTGNDLGMSPGANGLGTEAEIRSLLAGFELTQTSGVTPTCVDPETEWPCLTLPEERDADIHYVGVTADGSKAYFAIAARAAWSIPHAKVEFDIYLDTNGDGSPDFVLYNEPQTTDDQFDAVLENLTTHAVVERQPLDDREGDIDAALYDSDVMILPVSLSALGVKSTHPTVRYGVASFSNSQEDPVDLAGLDPETFDPELTADLHAPAVRLIGSSVVGPLLEDRSGSSVTVVRNATSYATDHGSGLLMLHLHDAVGSKAQVVAFPRSTTLSFVSPPGTGVVGGTYVPATSLSGAPGPVTYASLTPSVCPWDGGRFTFDAVGICTVEAQVAAGAGFEGATATTSIAIGAAPGGEGTTTAPPPQTTNTAKPLKCKKGFVKRKVRGKARCVKKKKRKKKSGQTVGGRRRRLF
ncbi:MAG TPA: S8 family serine peptidase [Solirubrobacterales bacterium]|nr:S8 family serine peptidase [Solirubrobacterales bacterium]